MTTPARRRCLLEALPPLGRTMVGLAMLSGVRRDELFALRWKDLDEQERTLAVREAVYEGRFDTPKTQAGVRQIPLLDAALKLVADCKPISPNNVLRRQVFPACDALELKHVTWLTLRRTYSSWAHEKGVPPKVVAAIMGHMKVDTTLNVYTTSARWRGALGSRSRRIRIVQNCSETGNKGAVNSLKGVARRTGRFPQLAVT